MRAPVPELPEQPSHPRRVLPDECVPRKLRFQIRGYACVSVARSEFGGFRDHRLLQAAQGAFDVFLTVDQGIAFQQRLTPPGGPPTAGSRTHCRTSPDPTG